MANSRKQVAVKHVTYRIIGAEFDCSLQVAFSGCFACQLKLFNTTKPCPDGGIKGAVVVGPSRKGKVYVVQGISGAFTSNKLFHVGAEMITLGQL